MFLDTFIEAIHEKKIVKITFIAKNDSYPRVRKCVPFDYSTSKIDKDKILKFQMYDLDSPNGQHNLSLHPDQIIEIEKLNETFEPADYVKWEPDWNIKRNSWGIYS